MVCELCFFFFHLFLLVGGKLLYNIVVVFAIHWHESASDLCFNKAVKKKLRAKF